MSEEFKMLKAKNQSWTDSIACPVHTVSGQTRWVLSNKALFQYRPKLRGFFFPNEMNLKIGYTAVFLKETKQEEVFSLHIFFPCQSPISPHWSVPPVIAVTETWIPYKNARRKQVGIRQQSQLTIKENGREKGICQPALAAGLCQLSKPRKTCCQPVPTAWVTCQHEGSTEQPICRRNTGMWKHLWPSRKHLWLQKANTGPLSKDIDRDLLSEPQSIPYRWHPQGQGFSLAPTETRRFYSLNSLLSHTCTGTWWPDSGVCSLPMPSTVLRQRAVN